MEGWDRITSESRLTSASKMHISKTLIVATDEHKTLFNLKSVNVKENCNHSTVIYKS